MPVAESTKTLIQELNDQGAELFLGSAYSEAIPLFCKGLAIVKGLCREDDTSTFLGESTRRTSLLTSNQYVLHPVVSKPVGRQLPPLATRPGVNVSTLSKPYSPALQDAVHGRRIQSPFLFMHPMLSSCLVGCNSDSVFLETACFSFVFNMAICHHLRSQSTGASPCFSSNVQTDARVASALYDLAFQTAISDQTAVPLVFSCAVLNNAAQLHRRMSNSRESHRLLATLIGFLPYCVDASQKHGNSNDTSMELLKVYLPEFFGAVSHLILEDPTANAA